MSHQTNQERDYFLPPVFTNPEDIEEEDEEDENAYLDYDYDGKESNYKDSPDLATVRSDAHDVSMDDKIPLHTAKDNLPIFLLEPENTYVVKNKPATLKCRAANALKVSNNVKFGFSFLNFIKFKRNVKMLGTHLPSSESQKGYVNHLKLHSLTIF